MKGCELLSQSVQLVRGEPVKGNGGQTGWGIVGYEPVADDVTRCVTRALCENRFERFIDGRIGVGANEDAIATLHGESGDGADHLGFPGPWWSPEIEEIMGERMHECGKLFGIEGRVWSEIQTIGDRGGAC